MRPAALAAYSASSAIFINSSLLAIVIERNAMPMLVVTGTNFPSTQMPADNFSMSLRAIFCGHGGRIDVFDEHDEFVAAQPRDQIRFAHAFAQPPRESDEHRVADGVAQRVVDLLEVVDVQIQQRDRHRTPLPPRNGQLQAFLELEAVGQACQRIEARQFVEFVFGDLEVGDVEHHRIKTDDFAVRRTIRHIRVLKVEMRPA